MKPEIKAKWVETLRSGEYRQCDQALSKPIFGADGPYIGFCCLGVLCDLVKGELPKGHVDRALDGRMLVSGHTGMPSSLIYEHTGLFEKQARVLALMNDGGASFQEIATFIEEKIS